MTSHCVTALDVASHCVTALDVASHSHVLKLMDLFIVSTNSASRPGLYVSVNEHLPLHLKNSKFILSMSMLSCSLMINPFLPYALFVHQYSLLNIP